MTFRWCANDGPTLNAGLEALKILRISGIRSSSIAKKPYIFVIFQEGGLDPPVSPLWIRTYVLWSSNLRNCRTATFYVYLHMYRLYRLFKLCKHAHYDEYLVGATQSKLQTNPSRDLTFSSLSTSFISVV